MTSVQPLKGQKALVTGAGSGIGKTVAIALGKAGAVVAVNYRGNPEPAIEVTKKIGNNGGIAMSIEADVSNEEQVKDMFKKILYILLSLLTGKTSYLYELDLYTI